MLTFVQKVQSVFLLKVYAQVVIDYDFFQSLNGLEFEFGIYLLQLSLLCIIKYVLWFAPLLLTCVCCFYSCNLTNWVLWCLHWDHSGKHGWHHTIQSKYSTFCFMWNCCTLRCVSWFVVCQRIHGQISPYKFWYHVCPWGWDSQTKKIMVKAGL